MLPARNNMNEIQSDPHITDDDLLKDGVLWRSFDETVILLNERTRPVLAFVLDHGAIDWPFLREILGALPKNEKLRVLLDGPCVAMLLHAGSIPEYLATLGSGSGYHVAILSPAGFTTMVRFDHITGDPDSLVEKIVDVLERLAPIYAHA